jgi:hypothetical protein
MSLAPAHWELPGPSAFVVDIVEEARATGIVAVVTPRHCPSDLDAALKDRLGVFDLPIIDARHETPPLEALSSAFDVELKSAGSLPSSAEAEGRAAFVIELEAASVSRWETTVRAYLAGCGTRPRFGATLILGASPDCQSALRGMGVGCLPWRNVIGFRDALLWALRDRKIADPMLGRLAAETAVCLAGWELEEVSRQMQRLHSIRAIFEIPARTFAAHPAVADIAHRMLTQEWFWGLPAPPRLPIAESLSGHAPIAPVLDVYDGILDRRRDHVGLANPAPLKNGVHRS